MNEPLILYLEELAANAWPAALVQHLDGWRLRYAEGVHGRTNSVWPNGHYGYHSLAEKLAWVEAFYGRYALPPRYQITPAMQPAHLDDVLAERGYQAIEHTHVQTAVIPTLLHQTAPTHAVALSHDLSTAWQAFDNATGQFSAHAARVRQGIMERIAPPKTFAAVHINDQIAGIGLGVYERGWVGVFNMLTAPAYRQQGVATAVLHHLACWGQQLGAQNIYLQVMVRNQTAQSLYHHAGFTTLYTYHYRVTDA